mgnify:CR=1 FL=1
MSEGAASDRIAALDLVRGIAVLGILTINIASFAGGSSAILSPDLLGDRGPLDHLTFATGLVLFEGKFRGLFTLLFGASMLLFVDRRDAAGADGSYWQLRRLGWLFLIGYLHQLLLWKRRWQMESCITKTKTDSERDLGRLGLPARALRL